MRRLALSVAAALCALSVAPAARACSPLVFADTLPGETYDQRLERSVRTAQDALRTEADAIFLAQVSAARLVGARDGEYTLTPIFPLYDTDPPERAVTWRDSPFTTSCEIQLALGDVYVVYAVRNEANWRVMQILRHSDLRDPPPGMPTARDVARGFYALPTYPE